MKRLFLSRSIKEDSPFRKLESDTGVQLVATSLVTFEAVDPGSLPRTDWVFFYSQRAIAYFHEQYGMPSDRKYGVMGEGSADAFFRITDRKPDFIGEGGRQNIANALSDRLGKEKHTILVPRAGQSFHFLEDHLTGGHEIVDMVIYRNMKKTDLKLPHCDYLAFTSPLNAEAYFEAYDYKDQALFAIGPTTAKRVEELTGKQPMYCKPPGIAELYNLVKEQILGAH